MGTTKLNLCILAKICFVCLESVREKGSFEHPTMKLNNTKHNNYVVINRYAWCDMRKVRGKYCRFQKKNH